MLNERQQLQGPKQAGSKETVGMPLQRLNPGTEEAEQLSHCLFSGQAVPTNHGTGLGLSILSLLLPEATTSGSLFVPGASPFAIPDHKPQVSRGKNNFQSILTFRLAQCTKNAPRWVRGRTPIITHGGPPSLL